MTTQFPGQPPWQAAPVPKPWRDWLSAFINWVTSRGAGSVTSVATGTGLTGGPITTTGTVSLANTLVTPGSYTLASITVDAQGRLTSASNGIAATVTSVALSAPAEFSVGGSPVTTTGTLALSWSAGSAPFLALAGGTMVGTITMGGNLITNPKITTVRETAGTSTLAANVLTLDLSTGSSFAVTLNQNVTTVTISNVPATGQYVPIIIEITQDGTGGRTVTGWPAGTKWPGGTAPTITATANAVDIISGYTRDGGTTYRFARAHTDSK